MSKKRLVIEYNPPPEEKPEEYEPDFFMLADMEIPDTNYNRSAYLHSVQVATEKGLIARFTQEKADRKDDVYASETRDKIVKYVREKRNRMGKKHRKLAWLCRCRLDFMLGSLSKVEDFNKYALERRLSASMDPIRNYTIRTLWRAINILIGKFNRLPYSPDLEGYVYALYSTCARFAVIKSTNAKTHHHPLLSALTPSGEYAINDLFLKETERIFRELEAMFARRSEIVGDSGDEPFPRASGEQSEAFYSWLREVNSGIYKDFIEKEFRKYIYEVHIYPTEKERYREEESNVGEGTTFGIIAKYRYQDIDALSKTISSVNYVEDIISEHKEDFEKLYVDINFDLACYILTKYYLESIVSWIYDTSSYIITKLSKTSVNDILFLSESFPRIVQVFNEYGIVYKRKCAAFPDYMSCFLGWIKTICEDPDINGVVKDGMNSSSFFILYERFYPKEVGKLKRPERENMLPLPLLENYKGIKSYGTFV